FVLGDIATNAAVKEAAGEGYDLVLANIIAEILAGITPHVPRHIKKGGIYITSGILITHADLVREALAEAGFTVMEEKNMGEWMSIVARK
ncbi:MAG: 50S ribosomal protein L11 methyltransferase, partial [bacterium]